MYIDESCAGGLSDVAEPYRMYTDAEIQRIIRDRVLQAGGVRRVGEMLGISPSFVCQASLGHRPISPKILKLFGYERIFGYRLKETKP